MGASAESRLVKAARKRVAESLGHLKCDRCPPHSGCNASRRPKSDHHKSKRKGR